MKTAHKACGLVWHLGMDDAAGGFHPLRATRLELTSIAHGIVMHHVTIEHVGERNKTAVRVIRKAGDVLVWIIAAEVVEHQKRIKVTQRWRTNGAVDLDTCPFGKRRGMNEAFDFSGAHVQLSYRARPTVPTNRPSPVDLNSRDNGESDGGRRR